MNKHNRLSNYLRGVENPIDVYGSHNITPRQRRRLRKKANQESARDARKLDALITHDEAQAFSIKEGELP